MSDNQENKSRSRFLKVLGIVFIIVLIISGIVFVGKYAYKKHVDNYANTDGNPILMNRAATANDFNLEQSFEATLTSLKDSYILVPKTDIKDLKVTFKFYDSSNNLVCTHTEDVGNVYKSQSYTISISHSLSEIFRIEKFQYTSSGGTVSYFA